MRKKKKKQKLPITTTVTTTHTDREHYKIYVGMDVGKDVQGRLIGNEASHPDHDHQVRPGIKFVVDALRESEPQEQVEPQVSEEQLEEIRGAFKAVARLKDAGILQVPHHGSHEFQKNEPAEPPRFAEYLAYLLPKSHRESLLGDLVETYPKLKSKQGKWRAWFWAYAQVGMSMWSLWGQTIIKWGLIAWVGDMIRRFTR